MPLLFIQTSMCHFCDDDQSVSHSAQSSSITRYFSITGANSSVPTGSSALSLAKVIGSAYVPVPPAVSCTVGKPSFFG